jgi:hypothetical protein
MLNVVPKSVAHTIVANDIGASEFDLAAVQSQLEFDYLDEVSRRLAEAVEDHVNRVPTAS